MKQQNYDVRRRLKLNNKGSSIVTVIVVIAFVSILATTVLYISGMNYYMKVTDQKTKESFYEAETALEEIKADICAEADEAAQKAYMDVIVSYASSDANARYSLFQNNFFNYLEESWVARATAVNPLMPDYGTMIQNIVESTYTSCISLDASIGNAGQLELHATEGYALIKGIELNYTDSNGYTTIITTDYMITVPHINWDVDSSKTSFTAGDSMERDKNDILAYVTYYNWTKK